MIKLRANRRPSTHAGDNRFRRTTGEGPSRGRRSIRNRAHGHPKGGGRWPGQIRLASTEGGPTTARAECEARCSCRNWAPSCSSRRRRQTRSCGGPTLGTSQQVCGQRLRPRTGRCHGGLHRGRRARELRRLLCVGYCRTERDLAFSSGDLRSAALRIIHESRHCPGIPPGCSQVRPSCGISLGHTSGPAAAGGRVHHFVSRPRCWHDPLPEDQTLHQTGGESIVRPSLGGRWAEPARCIAVVLSHPAGVCEFHARSRPAIRPARSCAGEPVGARTPATSAISSRTRRWRTGHRPCPRPR
jgi:hypothetical protein